MWCKGEKAVKPTANESEELAKTGTEASDGSFASPDGRRTFTVPERPNKWGVRHVTDWDKADPVPKARLIRRSRFFLPDLPPASIRYYEALTPAERSEVDALRLYWISLREFKNRLALARWLVFVALILPCLLLLGVYAAALERVPLTGRWRIILLTAEEEDKISTSLAGVNWYKSVINLLTTVDHPAPPIVPATDWRWNWAEGVLRQLEAAVLKAVADGESPPSPYARPPPPDYPLRPRPRVSTMLHNALPSTLR